MDPQNYPIPPGLHPIPNDLLDLRPDSEVEHDLLSPKPTTSCRNIWFFWHSGYKNMYPYARRTVHTWHRRLSKKGWTIQVLDLEPCSPLHISNFLDITDPSVFPQAFRDGTITGDYACQHYSDLVRWPLLLKYRGVYADVGMIQIGDLDHLWWETVGNPSSAYEVLSYDDGEGRSLTNYFLASKADNPLFRRCHDLLLKLWEGKVCTEGMHASLLLRDVPLMGDDSLVMKGDDGEMIGPDVVKRMLTDYIIQGQVMTMVMGLVDEESGWNGPNYVAEHVYGIEFMLGAQLINELTNWDGQRAFDLMSLPLPREGEVESTEQKQAREIVEACLQRSFGFKLATGMILRVMGKTLSSLWRDHEGSDDVSGTYVHWFRHGTTCWNQDEIPPTMDFKGLKPLKKGLLLREK